MTADWTRAHSACRKAAFYLAALEYGQSLWMEGKPAQAILQLNKAWSAELAGDEPVLKAWPLPYRTLLWMLRHAPEGCFMGNPVRHVQHLATRVNGENLTLRSWRAWACFHLSSQVLDRDGFPPDAEQIEKESLVIPELAEVLEQLRQHGIGGEGALVAELMDDLKAL